MPDIALLPITPDDLQRLARGEPPAQAGVPVIEGALAPPFVAERSLQQLRAGVPWHWCSTFHIVRTTPPAIVGGCGFKHAPRNGQVEIGYGVAPSCRGRGHARQAVQALLQRAFASGEVTQVLARVSPDNPSSLRVVQALAFRRGDSVIDEQGERLVEWLMHLAEPTGRSG